MQALHKYDTSKILIIDSLSNTFEYLFCIKEKNRQN